MPFVSSWFWKAHTGKLLLPRGMALGRRRPPEGLPLPLRPISRQLRPRGAGLTHCPQPPPPQAELEPRLVLGRH